jgi:threonine/homoserine/homoserine lactone efflux protein
MYPGDPGSAALGSVSWPQSLAPLARFLMASSILAITPGPGVVYIVTRTLADGRLAGLQSVLGVAVGNLANALAAAAGLTLFFSLWPAAFNAVIYAGALYLVYLGLRGLRPSRVEAKPEAARPDRAVIRSGLTVAILNPKTALFFASFLPQFSAPERSAFAQTVALAVLFVAIAATTDTLYVLLASLAVRRWLRVDRADRVGASGRFVGSAVLVLLGLFVAASHALGPPRP